MKQSKGFQFVESSKVEFSKVSNDERSLKQLLMRLRTSKQGVLNKIAQWISEGSVWTIKSVDNHYINSVKHQPLKRSLHSQLPKKLRNAAKGLINIKNDDNECFRWCHISHLKPQEKPSEDKKD